MSRMQAAEEPGHAPLRAVVVALLLVSAPAPAGAEEATLEQDGGTPDGQRDLVLPRPNQGHFLSVALLSTGALGFDSARTDRSFTAGVGVSVQIGEAVTDWLDLGLGVALGETFGSEDDRLAFGRLTLHSQWYYNPRWFARFDIGASIIAGRDPREHSLDRGGYGDVYAVGVGHNLFLSPDTRSGGWVLSPVLGIDLAPSEGLTAVIGWAGLEVSFWNGLTKDKLRLPVDRAYR